MGRLIPALLLLLTGCTSPRLLQDRVTELYGSVVRVNRASGIVVHYDTDWTYVLSCAHVLHGELSAAIMVFGSGGVEAEVLAADLVEDLALLRFPRFAALPATRFLRGELRLLEPVYAVGCPLDSPVTLTEGRVVQLEWWMDGVPFVRTTALSIWGNSGSAVFVEREGKYRLAGILARTYRTGCQMVTHMSYFVPASRILEWLDREGFSFIADGEEP